MKGKLVAHKYGSFVSKDTGEAINYDKFIVMSQNIADHDSPLRHYRGYEINEYRAKYLCRPSAEYDDLIGKIVTLTFDQVYGSKNPELVDITIDERDN